MRRFLVFAILQLINCSCPDKLELTVDGECIAFLGTMSIRDDQAADSVIAKCKEMHAHPIIIHNDEQQTYWTNVYKGDPIPIALVCNNSSSQWEWSDGSAVDFKPPNNNYNSNLDKPCTPNCVWIIGNTYGYWGEYCDNVSRSYDVYCTAELHPKQSEISDDACAFFADDTDDGVCYQVEDAAESWQDAQMTCLKVGANLASIHNVQENSFLRRLAVSKGATAGIYLGAAVSGKGGSYGWIDGSDWDYDNFAPGFPIPGFGDCIVMDTSTPSGQWMNIECLATLPVACIREHQVITEPTCSPGPFEEEAIITSPGFPYSASTSCDWYLKVGEGKKVEVEIILLEANSCCDSLVIYDGHVGGVVLANLTGEIHNTTYTTTVVNTMRVSWQPKGGVNVLGMAMTFRGV